MIDINVKSAFIRKRNNNYNVYVEYIDENTGKPRQKSLEKYKSKKDAEKHLIDLKSSINNNKYIIPKDITLVDRCKRYLEDHKEKISITSFGIRERSLSDIESFFKDVKLNDVTIYQVQSFINNLCKKHKLSTVKSKYSLLRLTLKEAYRLKEINENICDFIQVSKREEKFRGDVYTKEEIRKVIQVLEGSTVELPILLMMTLGLRFGEAAGLKWCDVDFENNIININQILVYTKKTGFLLKDPKTFDSKRSITAPKELMNKLKNEKQRQNKIKLQGVLENEFDLVCLNSYSRPWYNASLRVSFKELLERNNLKRIRLHDLRHTNSTMQILAGVNVKVISKRLGHSDINTTLNIYSHVLKEMDDDASDKIADIMFK